MCDSGVAASSLRLMLDHPTCVCENAHPTRPLGGPVHGVATCCVAGVALWPWEDPGRGRRAMEACLGLACVCAGDCADGSTLVCRAPSACVNEELSTATTRPLRSYCLVTTNVTWL